LEPLALDLTDPEALARAASGCFAVVCTAGPFQHLSPDLPRAAVESGAHWLDIADDRSWLLRLLSGNAEGASAAARGVAIIPGLSTTPCLSGVLVRSCLESNANPRRASLALFIGNRNAKGTAAIASLLESGLRDARSINLPIGRRISHRFSTADSDLLRDELGLAAEFRVCFELQFAGLLTAGLSTVTPRLDPAMRWRLAGLLSFLAEPANRLGTDSAILQASVESQGGRRIVQTLIGSGQRMAILPCALAVESLLDSSLKARGLVHPTACMSVQDWIGRLVARGLQLLAG
jgi:hypothetical protein